MFAIVHGEEMHRDMNHLSTTIKELRLEQYLHKIMDVLQEEMNDGRLKTVPLPFVFYTFYSALTVPFLTKNLSASFFWRRMILLRIFWFSGNLISSGRWKRCW